jgi:thymidine kinase
MSSTPVNYVANQPAVTKPVGKLNLIIGCMFSSKTSTLITRGTRYKLGGKKCIFIKYKNDIRYSKDEIATHDHKFYDAIPAINLADVETYIQSYDVVLIDEVQFYPDAAIYCDKWANEGKIVEACGLSGDFQRKPFEQISLLISLADSVTHVVAVDKNNGQDAAFTHRHTNDTTQVVIGGENIYEAFSRQSMVKHQINHVTTPSLHRQQTPDNESDVSQNKNVVE